MATDLSQLKIEREPSAPRAKKKRSLWPWIMLAVVGAGVWWFRTPLQRFFVEARMPKVEVAEAYRPGKRAQAAASGVSAGGYVVARVRAALSSDVPGRIVEMRVTEGQRLKAGDVVARLAFDEQESRVRVAESNIKAAEASLVAADARSEAARQTLPGLRSAVKSAEAELERAQAESEWAQGELTRIQNLRRQDLGTESDLDGKRRMQRVAQAGVRAAEFGLESAQAAETRADAEIAAAEAAAKETKATIEQFRAQRAEAQTILDKTFVRAPFDGVVVLKDAEVGEVVSPNSQGGNSRGAVATLVDLDSLEAQVELPEVRIGAIRVGGQAQIFLDAFPEQALAGRVDRIWPTANRQKATVEVRVSFDRLDDRIRPEMGLRVVFVAEESEGEAAGPSEPEVEPKVRVPERSVVTLEGQAGVFVLEGETAVWRALGEIERRGGEAVLEGDSVQPGDRVILSPPSGLADGDRVRVEAP